MALEPGNFYENLESKKWLSADVEVLENLKELF